MNSENSELQIITPMPTTSSQSSSNEDPSVQTNSLDSDAPLLEILDRYPRGFATIAEGQKFVKDLQALRLVPTTLRSKLSAESNAIAKKAPRAKPVKQLSADEILAGL